MTVSSPTSIKSINPATLEVLAEVAVTDPAAISEAAQASREAFRLWRLTPLKDRLKKIENFHQLLFLKQDEIAKLITLEIGKPLMESYLGELSGPLDTCLWLIREAEKILSNSEIRITNPLMFGKKHYLRCEPAGVIGIISPWNYPFSIPVMTILMALAAGNTVILKPSEKSPLTGLKIGELFRQSGFPENVITIVTGDSQAGKAVANLDLARLIFTGSPVGGMNVMSAAASHIVPVSLELGGKDAAIILSDAPVERTARAITWGAFTNGGQACASIERLYLVRGGNTEKILDRVVELAGQLKIGDPLLETTEIGPLIDVQQYDHIVDQVEEAMTLGAKILCGAHSTSTHPVEPKKLAGYYYPPTVISNVNHNMKIMREESFGPVLPVIVVDSAEEAIALANDSMYGLAASIWSADVTKAKTIANKIDAALVFINDCLYTHALPELPWGGLKKSGFGRSHSRAGLLDLVNIKLIAIDAAPWHRLWWYPYGSEKLKAVRSGLQLLHGKWLAKNKLTQLSDFIASMLKLM